MKLTEEQARRESKKDLESVGINLQNNQSETPTSSIGIEDLASAEAYLPKITVQWHSWEELMECDEDSKEVREAIERAKKLEKRENPFER